MEDLLFYNTLDSTNMEARRLLEKGEVRDGTIIMAREQTEGKGQFGRKWHAEPGLHLAMTLILMPRHLTASELPTVGMRVSLGLVRAIRHLDSALRPMIKWPNDIYLLDRKCCGILIENTLAGQQIQHIIAGIGVNVNEHRFPDTLPNAISLYMVTHRQYDLDHVAKHIRKYVMETFESSATAWKAEYDQVLYGRDQTFVFDLQGDRVGAVMKGVDLDGKIILDTGDRAFISCYSHEVKWNI
jgi:BirA family biotin operon repressor/biotin-[acetyl-CoA-carboxylase] ligase